MSDKSDMRSLTSIISEQRLILQQVGRQVDVLWSSLERHKAQEVSFRMFSLCVIRGKSHTTVVRLAAAFAFSG